MAMNHDHQDPPSHAYRSHGRPALRDDLGVHRHGHSHGVVDPSIASTSRGLWTLKWSFIWLMVTAILQVVVVVLSGSVALLADTIHNFADAATAIPLGLAFWLTRRGAGRGFTYGMGRVEDFAGLAIIATILGSACVALYEAVTRLAHPQPVSMLWAVALASVIGFVGNEAVAIFRIRVGREIGSAALVADGQHARVDGWTSLSVLVGAFGVWAGFPLADPIVGVLISIAIFLLVWQSAKVILTRMLDGVEPHILDEIGHAAGHARSVQGVSDVRARWIGHRLHVEMSVTVPGSFSVGEGHDVGKEVRHQLLHHLPHLGSVSVHIDPDGQEGEQHHRIEPHVHDGLPIHAHE
jgi:cation diffusion facilitator family transporter